MVDSADYISSFIKQQPASGMMTSFLFCSIFPVLFSNLTHSLCFIGNPMGKRPDYLDVMCRLDETTILEPRPMTPAKKRAVPSEEPVPQAATRLRP